MKPLLIFLSLNCLLCHFSCEVTSQGDELDGGVSKTEMEEIVENAPSTPKKNSKPKASNIKRSSEVTTLPLGLSPALELIMNKENEQLDIRRDFIPVNEMKKDYNLVYFCPAESYDERTFQKIPQYKYCLFLKETSSAALSSIPCAFNPEPKLWDYPEMENTCGETQGGVRYRYLHEKKSLLTKIQRVKSDIDKVRRIRNDFIQVYSMCLLNQEETLYLKYHLIVPSKEEYYRTKNDYVMQAETQGFAHLHLGTLEKFYKEMEKIPTLKEMFGAEFADTVIPQMLISPKHIKPRIARNSLHNYLNIKPQWKSLEKDWLDLEDHIWELGLQHSKDVIVYAGTHDTVRQNGQELYFQVDKDTKLNVPLVWWKLIIRKSKKEGIIIAMQNVPKGYPNSMGERLCKKSICNRYGWEKINEIAYCCAFDEAKSKLLNLQGEKFKIRDVFDPSKNVSRIIKWFKHLLKR